MAFMPRPPPVTLTITCGARRTMVSTMRRRSAAARWRAGWLFSFACGGTRVLRLPG
jgi:hypothetical protein